MNESFVWRMSDQPKSQNVTGDGWIEQKRVYQKKALLFRTLALLWIVPAITSLVVILYQFPEANGLLNTLKLIRLEQWLCLLVFLLQPTFIYLALRYRRTEIPTEQVFLVEDPNHDPKNLC